MTNRIHCPECSTGFLRVLSDEELLKMFPMSRAAEFAKHPEIANTQYIYGRDGNVHERWGRPKRVGVYCDNCHHFHDMDERGLKETKHNNKDTNIGVKKIKGYGVHYFNKT